MGQHPAHFSPRHSLAHNIHHSSPGGILPVIGGVTGRFIVYGTDCWRWLMWVMAIASGATSVAAILFQRETYGPFLPRQKMKKIRRRIRPFLLLLDPWHNRPHLPRRRSAKEQTHWIVPLIGACAFGCGMLMSYVCIQTYLVDAFDQFAAN